MNSAIEGGLIAIGTLFVTRAYDYLILRKTHDFNLKKEYFVRKLNVFEKATSYYTIAHISIQNIAIIYKTITKEHVDFSPEMIKGMLLAVKENLSDIYKLTQETALSLSLYTDKIPEEFDEADGEKFTDLLGEIELKNQVIDLLNEELTTGIVKNKEHNDKLIESQLNLINDKIIEMNELSRTIKTKYKALTKSLRDDLKKFDS